MLNDHNKLGGTNLSNRKNKIMAITFNYLGSATLVLSILLAGCSSAERMTNSDGLSSDERRDAELERQVEARLNEEESEKAQAEKQKKIVKLAQDRDDLRKRYSTCMDSAAKLYERSKESPENIATAAESKCSGLLYDYQILTGTIYFQSGFTDRNITADAEKAANDLKYEMKTQVITTVVERRATR